MNKEKLVKRIVNLAVTISAAKIIAVPIKKKVTPSRMNDTIINEGTYILGGVLAASVKPYTDAMVEAFTDAWYTHKVDFRRR